MDPTPDHSVALDLLITEPTCAIYLSRPCVHGLIESDTECNPLVWTRDRYSPEVIDSLAGVLETAPYRDADLLLVGHSGGGQLASRLASRIPRTQGLITLGANLDLAAWVAHHGYDVDLTLGKKPFPLRPEIVQLHVLADGDRVVPNAQVIDFLEENAPQSKPFTIEGADHSCCWADNWTGIKAEWRAASGR